MFWTTKDKEGNMRTIDSNKATLWDLGMEFFLMGKEDKKEQKTKSVQKVEQKEVKSTKKFSWGFFILFMLLCWPIAVGYVIWYNVKKNGKK